MKHNSLLVTFLALSAVAVGCDKEATTSQQVDKVQAETKQAAQDMKDYTYAQKSAFVETMQAQLAALNRDLDQLAAKVEKSSDAAKTEAKPKLQALRDQADKLNQQLDKAKNATESTWDVVKADSKKAYNELKDGFQQARQWVSDKIAKGVEDNSMNKNEPKELGISAEDPAAAVAKPTNGVKVVLKEPEMVVSNN